MNADQRLILDLDAFVDKIVSRIRPLLLPAQFIGADISYSINELAQKTRVHPDTIRKLIRTGKLRRIRGIRHLRVPAKEWNRFLDQNLIEWQSTWSAETVEKAIRKRKKEDNQNGKKTNE